MNAIKSQNYQLFLNPAVDRLHKYNDGERSKILSDEAFKSARDEIVSWPGYAETPIRTLCNLANELRLDRIDFKDESGRFGLGSFKALGGAYAVFRSLQQQLRDRHGLKVRAKELVAGTYVNHTKNITVTCATDGNHGRSVAWGAKKFGCRCIIYVHATVSASRCEAIQNCGAEVRRVSGNYDDAVREAASAAEENGWNVISDTSYPGYVNVPRDVMQGYSLMVDEAINRLAERPTHVFVQGGVGGLAAAVCAHLWQLYGNLRPKFVVVEPDKADCLYQSAKAGVPVTVHGDLDTIMAGLACGEVSLLAWQILHPGADAFMTVTDQAAAETMRLLADGRNGEVKIVAGESAVAGLAGLIIAASDSSARVQLDLGPDSRILLFGTEGATDPQMYYQIVGRTPEAVKESAA